ncbi:methyltransferase domain-containing protein, partial [Candidatus Woesearchaeota archaeon]
MKRRKRQDIKETNKKFFDSWSKTYDKFLFRKLMWKWQEEAIKEIPKNCSRILEIAPGTGRALEILSKQRPNAKLCGTDISQGMIKIAKERLQGKAKLYCEDAENMHYENESFDAIFCTEAFHHFPNQRKAIREMSRVLKKEGALVIVDINIPPLTISNFLFKLEPGFVKMLSAKEMRDLLKKEGLH